MKTGLTSRLPPSSNAKHRLFTDNPLAQNAIHKSYKFEGFEVVILAIFKYIHGDNYIAGKSDSVKEG